MKSHVNYVFCWPWDINIPTKIKMHFYPKFQTQWWTRIRSLIWLRQSEKGERKSNKIKIKTKLTHINVQLSCLNLNNNDAKSFGFNVKFRKNLESARFLHKINLFINKLMQTSISTKYGIDKELWDRRTTVELFFIHLHFQ